jgi:plasmid stabilization system protein ParE
MKYIVLLLPKAEQDVDTIVGFLMPHSASGPGRWLKALESALLMLADRPTFFPLAPENDALAYTVRQVSFRTPRGRVYRIVFTMVGRKFACYAY